MVWFGVLRSMFLLHEGLLVWDLLLKADFERLQTSMPEAGFEPADYSTKWQRPTIRPSPGQGFLDFLLIAAQNLIFVI